MPTTGRDAQALLRRLRFLIETHHAGLAMMRRGEEAFRRDWLGVTAPTPDEGLFGGAGSAQDITARLFADTLSPEAADEAARREHLRLRVHQYAVLRALPHAARQVVQRLDPQAIGRELVERAGRFWRWLPWGRAGRVVQALEARYRDLTEEREQLDAAMVGPEFTRAYATTVRANDNPPGKP